MLYDTAAQPAEILALGVEDLDMARHRAMVRCRDGATEWVSCGSGTADLLPRLICGRTRGPVFLTERRPARRAARRR